MNDTPVDEPNLPAKPPRLRAQRRYVIWLISDTSKGLAATLFSFALPLITLFVTNDPTKAGILGGVGMGINILTVLLGGVIADRYPRIRMMILGGALGTVVSLVFTALAWMDTLAFPVLLTFEILLALRSGLFNIAGEAALKEIVPPELMGTAQAANQGRDAALQLAGGPLGGALLAVGSWLVGAVMTLSHLLSALAAAALRRPMNDDGDRQLKNESANLGAETTVGEAVVVDTSETNLTTPETAPSTAWAEIREGFAWLLSRPDLRGILFVATLINLALNTASTTVVYDFQQAGFSTVAIGTFSSGLGVVMLVGAVVAPFFVNRVGVGTLAIIGLLLIAGSMAGVFLVHTPLTVAAMLAPGILLIPILNSGLLGYFMVAVPSELLGRANAAISFVSMGAMPLAPLVAGFGLVHVGRTNTLFIAAGLAVVATLLALSNRGLRDLPRQSEWESYAARFGTAEK
ncbi:MAG: MFS transporter [Ancrocorticia sp.]